MHFIWHHLAPVSDSRLKKNRSRPKKNGTYNIPFVLGSSYL